MRKRIVSVVNGECVSVGEAAGLFSSLLLGFAKKRLRNPRDAEDAVQEVFLRATRYQGSFGTAQNQKAWLFQVMRSVIADHYRGDKVLPSEVEFHTGELSEQPEESWRDTEGCVRFLVGKMSTARGIPLLAVDLQKMPQKKLALMSDLPYSTIKSRVQRGRVRLKQILLSCCFQENRITGRVVADDACQSQMGCCSPGCARSRS